MEPNFLGVEKHPNDIYQIEAPRASEHDVWWIFGGSNQ